jgi:hypothetical protein
MHIKGEITGENVEESKHSIHNQEKKQKRRDEPLTESKQ